MPKPLHIVTQSEHIADGSPTRCSVVVKCKICQSDIQVYAHELLQRNVLYCSYVCAAKSRKGRKPWNFGLTKFTDPTVSKASEKQALQYATREISLTKKYGYAKFFRQDLGHGCRSTWEANFCRILKLLQFDYKYEKARFPIQTEHGIRIYIPDILLTRYNLLVEIKGHETEDTMWKYNRFRAQYPNNAIAFVGYEKYRKLDDQFSFAIDWESKNPQRLNVKHPTENGVKLQSELTSDSKKLAEMTNSFLAFIRQEE